MKKLQFRLIAAFVLTSALATECAAAQMGTVSLCTTFQGQPTLKKVTWTKDGAEISKKWSDVQHFFPGTYRFCAAFNGVERCQSATLMSGKTTFVNIELASLGNNPAQ